MGSQPKEDKSLHNQNDVTIQNEIQSHSNKKQLKDVITETLKLRLVIIDSQQLEIGKEYEIYSDGIKGHKTGVKDGCVYAGCEPDINDIILSATEKGVGNKHFMIQYDKKFKNKYAIRDLGEGMGTFVRIDSKLYLQSNYIISFGDSHMIILISTGENPKITLKFIDGPKLEQKL